MANEMGDTDLLVKLSCGMDIVAIEGKFHFSCVTNYHYHYHSFLHTQCGSSESSAYAKKAREQAFAELVMDMEGALERRYHMYSKWPSYTTYESNLKTLNITWIGLD